MKVSTIMYHETRREVDRYADSFGQLVKDVNVKGLDQSTIFKFILFDFARRLAMAFVIVHVTTYPWAQLMFVMYLNQFYMMFTTYFRIFEERRSQVISNINEIITLLTVYHLFCFTDIVPNGETRALAVGRSMMGITFFNLLVNLGPIIPDILIHSKHSAKKKHLRYKKYKAIRDK